jgi:predicted flavoprotein YhiN
VADYAVTTAEGTFRASSLVIATGGLTVPKIGATPFGYQVAAQFRLAVVPPRPALVPLAFAPEWLERYGDLAGVSLDVEASCNGGRFRENLLFTHRGLSGPAILQVSSYWDGKTPLSIDLLPGGEAAAWFRDQRTSTAQIDNVLAQRLSRRFVDAWCAEHSAAGPLNRLDARRFDAIESGAPRLAHPALEARSATTKPKSRAAASTLASCRRKPWARRACPASISSARSST